MMTNQPHCVSQCGQASQGGQASRRENARRTNRLRFSTKVRFFLGLLVSLACLASAPHAADGSDPTTEAGRTQAVLPTNGPAADGPAANGPAAIDVDQGRLAAAGIRKIVGKHLTLYTDVADDAEVAGLPRAFDAAVPQWCRYFGIDQDKTADWRLTGFLIDRKESFRALGLLPADLPPFLHGYQRGGQLWLYEQPTAYYRRHLLLHEGTHAFMKQWCGGAGPPWYMEGVAELLATHALRDGKLTLKVFPTDKRATPGWGRIKIVKDSLAAGHGLTLTRVMQYDSRAHLKNEPYGWCWAASAFLDAHPRTRKAFRGQRAHVADTGLEFSRRFYRELAADWPLLHHEWQLFALNLEYGYDIERSAIERVERRETPAEGAAVRIAADRGWQSTGLQVKADATYHISSDGRFQVARQPEIWWCEPNGVTIRYVNGRPLGTLLGAVCDDRAAPSGLSPLARPLVVGKALTLKSPRSGVLYLKINDSPAELADNDGFVTVRVTPD